MRQTRLQKRHGTYYYRQRVPKDLLGYFTPQREFVVSLRTTDPKQARQAAFAKAHEFEQECQRVRAGGFGMVPRQEAQRLGLLDAVDVLPVEQAAISAARRLPSLVSIPSVDDELITRLCSTYLRDSLNGDLEFRAAPPSSLGEAAASSPVIGVRERAGEVAELREMLATGNVNRWVHDNLRRFLLGLGYGITETTPGYRQLCGRFVETLIREGEAIETRNSGRAVDVEQLAPLEKTLSDGTGMPGITIQTLVERWKQSGVQTPKTVAEYMSVADEFAMFLMLRYKVTQATHVQKRHVIAYRDNLLGENKQYKTILKRIGIVKTIFNVALQDDTLPVNPAHLVKVKRAKVQKKARVPFTVSDLNAIFRSDIYTKRLRPAGCGEHAAYWVPLLALFTGMRVEEICQLRINDLQKVRDGWFISVVDGDGQSIKTESSRRHVPVHRELENLGLIDFLVKKRLAGNEWLFPDLSTDKYGRRSSMFSKSWNRHLRRSVGITDRKKSFHSFRHGFKHFARECGIEEAVHDAITGHGARESQGRMYGDSMYPAGPLFSGIRSFNIAGLDLKHLQGRNPSEKRGSRRRAA